MILDYFKSRARLIRERNAAFDDMVRAEIRFLEEHEDNKSKRDMIGELVTENDIQRIAITAMKQTIAEQSEQLARFERVRDPETGRYVKVM